MELLSLPQELLDTITDEFYEDSLALCALSLTSPRFVTRAHTHLFHSVSFQIATDCLRFAATFHSSPRIPLLVKKLSISRGLETPQQSRLPRFNDVVDEPTLRTLIRSFKNLEEVSLASIVCPHPASKDSYLGEIFRHPLVALNLSYVRFDGHRHFTDVVRAFKPTLRRLVYNGSPLYLQLRVDHAQMCVSPFGDALECISLEGSGFGTRDVLDCMVSPCATPPMGLRRLECTTNDPAELGSLGRMLSLTIATLEHVRLEFRGQSPTTESMTLSQIHHLKSLTLHSAFLDMSQHRCFLAWLARTLQLSSTTTTDQWKLEDLDLRHTCFIRQPDEVELLAAEVCAGYAEVRSMLPFLGRSKSQVGRTMAKVRVNVTVELLNFRRDLGEDNSVDDKLGEFRKKLLDVMDPEGRGLVSLAVDYTV